MRIMLINHFPLTGSGSGTYTLNIALHLIKKGHEVCIVFPENTTSIITVQGAVLYPVYFTDKTAIKGAADFNFPCFTTHPRSQNTFLNLSEEQESEYIRVFETVIEGAVNEFKPDIIHAQHIWILSYLASKTGIPYIITAHGTDLMGYSESERYRKYAEIAARNAKKIICISEDNAQLVRELFPDCTLKTIIMRNGYNPAKFYPETLTREQVLTEYELPPLKHLVFFSGKHTHFKGIDTLLLAAKKYESQYPDDIQTIIAGEGELTGELKRQTALHKLRNVHFIGFVDHDRLRRLYSIADVTVVPSRREPFGLVAVEALSCACPVVATNQGGLPDIIDENVGTLVDADDPGALCGAILSELFCENRVARRKYAASYAYDKYAQDSLIDTLIEIYRM